MGIERVNHDELIVGFQDRNGHYPFANDTGVVSAHSQLLPNIAPLPKVHCGLLIRIL